MFLIGAILLIVGALTLNRFGSLLSAGSVFGGILLVVFGLFVQLGFLSGNLRSLGGVGTILICLSIVLGAFSIAVVEFVEITGAQLVADIFRGVVHWGVVFYSDRPYIWLSVLCMQFGIGFFVAGVVLKIVHAIKP
jgi:hypothetical protein